MMYLGQLQLVAIWFDLMELSIVDLPSTPSEKEIEARLKNLKDDKKPPPSDEEMARRLAVLKGQDPDTINKPPIVSVHHLKC